MSLTTLLDDVPRDRNALLLAESRTAALIIAECETQIERLTREATAIMQHIESLETRIQALTNESPRVNAGSINRPVGLLTRHGQDTTGGGRRASHANENARA